MALAVLITPLSATAQSRTAIHIDLASFAEHGDAGLALRVGLAVAIAEILHRFRSDFPQPPPVNVEIRAQSRVDAERYDNRLSYGGADLVDADLVVISVNPLPGLVTSLNDAELRSFLGHELMHAYQFVAGPYERNSPELWRREVQALEWEMARTDPAVRPWYRAETETNLGMYRALLSGARIP